MFGFGKKSGPTIALDINSNAISVLQLENVKQEFRVTHFATQPTPPNTVKEGLITDPKTLGQLIKELITSAGISISKDKKPVANIALPGQSIVIRLIPVPKEMPEDELNDVVIQEAQHHLPFSIEEANLDWTRVPHTTRLDTDGIKREDIMLVAAQNNTIANYLQTAEIAGLQLGALEINPLAALRALALSKQLGDDKTCTLLVNICQEATDIVLISKAVPLFIRCVLLGVNSIIQSIIRSVNCSPEEATALLSRLQLSGIPTTDIKTDQAAHVTRSICSDLSAEISRSLEFYISQAGKVQIDQIIVCGSGLQIPEIDQFLATRLHFKTIVANPFQTILDESSQIPSTKRAMYTTLVGLLVNTDSLPEQTLFLNLNKGTQQNDQEEEAEEIPTPWFVPTILCGSAIAIIVTMVWAYFQFIDIPNKLTEIKQLEAQMEEAKSKIGLSKKAEEEIKQLEQRKIAIDAIAGHKTPVSIVLDTIKQSTPEDVQIASINIQDNNLTILGNTITFAKAAHLLLNLQGSNKFSSLDIAYTKRQKKRPQYVGFQINGTLSSTLNNQSITCPTDNQKPIVSKEGIK